MDSDIAAAVARVRTHAATIFERSPWGPAILNDIITVCDFAERHMEPPADVPADILAEAIRRADAAGGDKDQLVGAWRWFHAEVQRRAQQRATEPPADLVETVARALLGEDVQEGWILLSEDEAAVLARAAVAALAGRIVPEGCVAVRWWAPDVERDPDDGAITLSFDAGDGRRFDIHFGQTKIVGVISPGSADWSPWSIDRCLT